MKQDSEELMLTKAIIDGDKSSFNRFYSSEYNEHFSIVNQYVHDIITVQRNITHKILRSALWEKRNYLDPHFLFCLIYIQYLKIKVLIGSVN
jgi:hypothetical protein